MRRVAREAFERQSLERIIRQALNESKAKGRDHITQTELSVRAGLPEQIRSVRVRGAGRGVDAPAVLNSDVVSV